MVAYWQKREDAKAEIATTIRDVLMEQFNGLPVIVVRNCSDKIRHANKSIVSDILAKHDCEEFIVNWQIFFTYRDDEDGVARISDFDIKVEGV